MSGRAIMCVFISDDLTSTNTKYLNVWFLCQLTLTKLDYNETGELLMKSYFFGSEFLFIFIPSVITTSVNITCTQFFTSNVFSNLVGKRATFF